MREALPIAALAVLATVKLWPIVTPFAGSRLYLGGDFGLAIEPYFYHLLKRGILPLWDATLGTGSPFLGSGTYHPMFLQAHLHLFCPVNLLVLGLLERGQQIPHVVLQYNHLLHYAMAGAFTYLYARQLAVGRFAAAVSGIAFMFSGFMLAHVTHWTMIDTVVWLPAILACVVRTDASLRRRWATLAGRGVPRRPSTALLSRRAGDRRARRHADHAPRGGRRPVGTARGNPAARAGGRTRDRRRAAHPHLGDGGRVSSRGAGYDWKSSGSLPPAFLAQAFLPGGLFTAATWRTSGSEFYLYPGVLPLILALYAATRRWDWRTGFHATLATRDTSCGAPRST